MEVKRGGSDPLEGDLGAFGCFFWGSDPLFFILVFTKQKEQPVWGAPWVVVLFCFWLGEVFGWQAVDVVEHDACANCYAVHWVFCY